MAEPFDETTCDRCGHVNPVWWTPSKLWQRVYGAGGQPTRQGVLCPTCFVHDAEAAGVAAPSGEPGWLVQPSPDPGDLGYDQAELWSAYEGLWSAALALSALLETEWPHGWSKELRWANAEVRRLTDDPDARAEGDNG